MIRNQYGETKFWVGVTACIVATLLFIGGLVVAIQAVVNHIESVDCGKFHRSSGLETKFVYFGFWNTDCYVQIADGNWIPRDKLILNVGN